MQPFSPARIRKNNLECFPIRGHRSPDLLWRAAACQISNRHGHPLPNPQNTAATPLLRAQSTKWKNKKNPQIGRTLNLNHKFVLTSAGAQLLPSSLIHTTISSRVRMPATVNTGDSGDQGGGEAAVTERAEERGRKNWSRERDRVRNREITASVLTASEGREKTGTRGWFSTETLVWTIFDRF
jgi:hypothetical protein